MEGRELQICAAHKLFLVKMLCEEPSFKTSFEGRETRAVTAQTNKKGNKKMYKSAKGTQNNV